MSAQSGRLQHAIKNLRDHWELARETWDDQVARDFEKNHIMPLEQLGRSAMVGMDKLSEVFMKLKHACEEER
jgi:hypothetical protein